MRKMTKLLSLLVMLTMSVSMWAASYCSTTFGEGSQIANFTWVTDADGNVVITISEADGGEEGTTNFRKTNNTGNGMCDDGLGKFKVGAGKEAANNYFDRQFTRGEQTYTLKLKDGVSIPVGTIIYFEGVVEFETSANKDCWPTFKFEYSYGTGCEALSQPTDVAVASTGRVTFTDVANATEYEAHIYDAESLVATCPITNGGVLQFVTEKETYSVKIVAKNPTYVTSEESAPAAWNTYAHHVFGVSDLNNYTYSGFENGGSKVALTANTNSKGDVVITISNVSGDAPVLFRDGALTASKFKVYFGEDFADYALATAYFDISKNDAKTCVVLSRKDNAQLPYPCIIKFDAEGDGALEWTANGVGKWTRPKFQYTYGTTCRVNEGMPGNVSVSTMGRVKHDNVAGAEKYAAIVINEAGEIVLQQDITSGAPLNWIPTVGGDYKVTVIAFDAEGNMFDVPAETDWTVEAGHVYGITNIYVKDYGSAKNANGANNIPAYFTWETVGDNVIISIAANSDGTRGEAKFRNNALRSSDFDAAVLEKFDYTISSDKTYCMLTLKDGETAPAKGTILHFNGQVEYTVPSATGAWPSLEFSYVYGTPRYPKEATAPVIASFTGESNDYTTATLTVAASDKDDDNLDQTILTYSLEGDNDFVTTEVTPVAGVIELTDLKKNKIYHFTLTVTDPSGNSASENVEVKMKWDASENLALNKPSEANATQGDNRASKANDDNTTNFWTSYDAAKPEGDDYYYWQVDLEELYAISSVKIIFNDHNGTYNVLSSTDGTEWHTYKGNITDVTNVHQNEETPYIIENAVTARYFRFTSTSSRVGIKEFRVYGAGYAGADSQKPVITAFSGVSNAATEVTFHVEASDVDDNDKPQTLTYSLAGNNDFAAQAIVLDSEGNFTISGLKKNRDYEFTLTAIDPSSNQTESDPITVRMQFDPSDNLALNKPAEASAIQGDGVKAPKANDGNTEYNKFWTPWGNGDANAWWKVDLGYIFELSTINVYWHERANNYTIYGSFTGEDDTWFPIIAHAPATDNTKYELAVNAAARYLKLVANKNTITLTEFEVFGSAYATTDAVAPQVTVTEVSKTENTATLKIVATDADDAGVAHPVKSITISGDNDFETIENAELDGDGNITLNGLKDNATYNFHVTVTDRVGLTAEQDIEVRVAFNTTTNLALASNGATAEAGCANDPVANVNDGETNTYWGTWNCGDYEHSNVLTITLAASYNINNIVIKTAGFDGTATHNVKIESSKDNTNWTLIKDNIVLNQNNGDAGQSFDVIASGKYIRMTSSTNHMIAIKEFEIYGSGYDDPDTEKPVIESAALVGDAGEESAVVSVEAKDNVGVFGLQFVDAANDFNVEFDYIHGQHVTLVGLAPGTTYHFSIYALDRAGNVSEPKALEITTANNPNVPHTAAPAPTIAEARVISIFSNTYEPAIKDMKQWAAYGGDVEYSAKVIAGNDYAYYVGDKHGEFIMGYKWEAKDGFTYGTNTGVNVASRAYIHLDVWALADGYINVCLDDATVGSGTLVAGQWNSIDLPISAIDLSIRQNLEWIKFTNIQGKTLAIDNIYFYGVAINQDADNSATLETFNNQTECAVLNRSFEADGYYYTLCLPFDMSADQIAEAFGDCEISEMTESELRGTLIHVNFAYTDHIVAGQPYIFLPKEDIKAPLAIDGVTIKNVASTTKEGDYIDFVGYLNPTNFAGSEDQLFLGASDVLHPLKAGQENTPGLRAYFQLKPSTPQGVRAKVVLGSQVTTGMEYTESENMMATKVMIDGQLYIIRAEKMYNVQGQLVK